ncbi:MAG TPA: tetratricopeptide repeat protein [Ignavibacteriaceae bacterium]|nr:tetratricopeptide repeat protein [Ignavibacteriaceae bacterium]
MQNTKYIFETELEELLKKYLGDDCFKINLSSFQANKSTDGVSAKINAFYEDQLRIDMSDCSDRMKIDRTITFSQKKLVPEMFQKFLLELGNICLSGGKLDLAAEIFKKTKNIAGKTAIKAESLLGLADVFTRRANWSRSLSNIADAESLYKKIKDNLGTAKCENFIGIIFSEMGDIETAKEHFLNSLSFIDPERDKEMTAHLETNLGIIDNIRGNFIESLVHFNKALGIYNKMQNKKNAAEVTHNIGMVYLESEEYEMAVAAFDDGINTAKEGHFIPILCLLYHAKSRALVGMNALYYAAEFADKALEISHAIDDKLALADIYKVKGIIERKLKNFKVAEEFLLNSLRINNSLGNEMNIAETSLELALLYENIHNTDSRQFYLKSSLDYYKEINASSKIKKIEELLNYAAA